MTVKSFEVILVIKYGTMLWIRIGCMAVRHNAYCAQLSKQTVGSGTYRSNVSKLMCCESALILSNNKSCPKKSSRRKRIEELPSANVLPSAFKMIPRKYESVRIIDEETANIIVRLVINQLNKNNPIVDFNAGSGILSNALLGSGMKNVVALEPHSQFSPVLQDVKNKYKESFNYYPLTLNELTSLSDKDLAEHLPENVCKKGHPVQIIGHAYSWHVLKDITCRMGYPRSFLVGKSVNLCLCLAESSWNRFLDTKNNKSHLVERIVFMLTCDYKVLTKFQMKNFHICVPKRFKTKVDFLEVMVLVQITTKLRKEFDVSELWVFLRQFHNHRSLNRLVIPSLEQWAPSCGEELVRRGMPVFARFSDLTPEEILDVFLYFKNLPGVKASGIWPLEEM